MIILLIVCIFILLVILLVFCIKFLPINILKKKNKNNVHISNQGIFELEKVVKECSKLNKNKGSSSGIGLFICIERKMILDEFFQSDFQIINADISARLIKTIFYEGTELHDGAIVIRNNKLYSAAAFVLNPSKDAPNVKFGARHRAAKGISQQSDCLVVLVSEETGNISLFIHGDEVLIDNDKIFIEKFRNFYYSK